MISKTIGFRGTLFSDTPMWQTDKLQGGSSFRNFSTAPRCPCSTPCPLACQLTLLWLHHTALSTWRILKNTWHKNTESGMLIFSLSVCSIHQYPNLPRLFLSLEGQRTKSIVTGLVASDVPRCADFTLIVAPSSSHQLFQDARNRAVGSLVLATNLVATPQSFGRIIL